MACGCWATADPTDAEEINLIINDLETYSKEAIAAIALGNKSVDEIDSVVVELEALGLNTLEEIRQSQYDRFLGK